MHAKFAMENAMDALIHRFLAQPAWKQNIECLIKLIIVIA